MVHSHHLGRRVIARVEAMHRLAHPDAMSYWTASKIPNDQFLLYCFAVGVGGTQAEEPLAETLLARARGIDDLTLRIADVPGTLDRPYWVHRTISADQIRVHAGPRSWAECLVLLGELMADQLDPTDHCWRLHLMGPVPDAPHLGPDGDTSRIAVLQIAHSLGDGRRTADIARRLFAAPPEVPQTDIRRSFTLPKLLGDKLSALPAARIAASGVMAMLGVARTPLAMAETVGRGLHAYRLSRGTQTSGKDSGVALTAWNRPPGTDRTLRVIVAPREQFVFFGHSVTVGALLAISQALPKHFMATGGGRDGRYTIELTIGRTGKVLARNNFRNAGIDLHVDVDDLRRRAEMITADIEAARDRADDAATVASRQATAAAPAFLNRQGVRLFDPTAVPEAMTGVSVLSSVNRGAANLELGGGPVQFTCGFPGLSPTQGVTHGLHGIGDTLALTVTTSAEIEPHVDDYVARLREAIDALHR